MVAATPPDGSLWLAPSQGSNGTPGVFVQPTVVCATVTTLSALAPSTRAQTVIAVQPTTTGPWVLAYW